MLINSEIAIRHPQRYVRTLGLASILLEGCFNTTENAAFKISCVSITEYSKVTVANWTLPNVCKYIPMAHCPEILPTIYYQLLFSIAVF